ncbi:hypothetical protein [Photobacterium atrarenae]|uniref:Calcineurin-like phosphoesterase domain-containing protein n=1 Tax=Photobacterium atrarenae TaxID=865757 RepID=A0ABY5GLJ2_9GAMM|nr:hypothetical protein [Photobacterium atrarenae]UTV29808.1 hypothetical protein NNL38_22640 [Photobacterium atrarenae]
MHQLPIAIIRLDEPPAEVAHLVGRQWTETLLHETDPFVVIHSLEELQRINIDHYSCFIICGLWHREAYHRFRQHLVTWLKAVAHRRRPLFAFGDAHHYLVEALGGESTGGTCKCTAGLHFVDVSASRQDSLTAGLSPTNWSWSLSRQAISRKPAGSFPLASSPSEPFYLLKHNNWTYSTHAHIGMSWSAMVTWLINHPEYLPGNEAVLESRLHDTWGTALLHRFLMTYGAVSRALH